MLNQIAGESGLKLLEGKQTLEGKVSGTEWEIDAKGVALDGKFLIVECRRHTTRPLEQEDVAGIAWKIYDVGAGGRITVTPLGLQEGAKLVAKASNIISVTLGPDSTTKDYILEFLNKVSIGVSVSERGKLSDSISCRTSLTAP